MYKFQLNTIFWTYAKLGKRAPKISGVSVVPPVASWFWAAWSWRSWRRAPNCSVPSPFSPNKSKFWLSDWLSCAGSGRSGVFWSRFGEEGFGASRGMAIFGELPGLFFGIAETGGATNETGTSNVRFTRFLFRGASFPSCGCRCFWNFWSYSVIFCWKNKKRVIFCQPNFSKPKKSFRSVNRKFLKNQLIGSNIFTFKNCFLDHILEQILSEKAWFRKVKQQWKFSIHKDRWQKY